jgi:hypothetical protein
VFATIRIALQIGVALGCGCATTTVPPAAGTTPSSPAALTPELFCARFTELRNAQCGAFLRMPAPDASCVVEARNTLAGTSRASRAVQQLGRCMIDHGPCDEVLACLAALKLESSVDLRACTDPYDGRAVGIPRAEYEQRNGVGITLFRQAQSTPERPIEMCTIRATNAWLATLACNDGSKPLHNGLDAERARMGNVGSGGRCHSVIDHYRVTCPEASYDLFTDGYICPSAR